MSENLVPIWPKVAPNRLRSAMRFWWLTRPSNQLLTTLAVSIGSIGIAMEPSPERTFLMVVVVILIYRSGLVRWPWRPWPEVQTPEWSLVGRG